MSRTLKTILTALLLLLLLPLAPLASGAAGREMVDFAGRRVVVPEAPQRVVALVPSIAELVFALGRQEVLKGVVQYSDYPPAARELPRVGSYHRPDIERIVALRPDLVLAIRDGNPIQAVSRIEALGIPVFAVDPRSLEDIMKTITVLGEILGARPQAEALTSDMAARIDRVRRAVADAPSRPSVFFQVDTAPVVAAGETSFLHELILLAGGRNALTGPDAWVRPGWEEILRLQPDVVVICSMAGGQTQEELLGAWMRWPQLRAVRENRIYVEDSDLFNRPGPRLVDGLEALARRLHPERFPAGP